MTRKLFLFLILIVLVYSPKAFGQEERKGVFSKLQNIFDGRNIIKDTLHRAEKGETTKKENLGLDPETAELVRSLKNPFIPQLPHPEQAIEGRTEQEEVPLPPEMTENFPMGPEPLPQKITKPSFTVSGLIWNSDLPQAILDGQIVTIGDLIKNWTIVNISKEGVEVTFKNFTYMIEP